MSRRPARFTEADVDRAMRVAGKHGMTVEILTDGTIRLVPKEQVVDKARPRPLGERGIVL